MMVVIVIVVASVAVLTLRAVTTAMTAEVVIAMHREGGSANSER